MSSQLHDGESARKKQVKFRARESLVEQFDDVIEGPRAEAFREFMQETVDGGGDLDVPNGDESLATAYRWLVAHSRDGTVRLRRARNRLAVETGLSERDVRVELLAPLETRGYVTIRDAPPGVQQDGCVRVFEHRHNGGEN